LQAHRRNEPTGVVVEVSGEVDMMSSPDLRKVLKEAVREKPALLVLNLDRVNYMDSSGIATLVECLKEMRAYGGRLRLAGMRQEIQEVFRLARLEEVFEIVPTEEEALGKSSGTSNE